MALLENLRHGQADLMEIINGSGSSPGLKGDVAAIRQQMELQLVPDVKARLEKLEAAEAKREKLVWAACAGVIGSVGLAIWNWIKLHG